MSVTVSDKKIRSGWIIAAFSVLALSALFVLVPFLGRLQPVVLYPEAKVSHTFLDAQPHERMLLYFGYVGCGDICPRSLDSIRHMYVLHRPESAHDSIPLLFVNLLDAVDTKSAKAYARALHPEFDAITVNRHTLKSLPSDFKLFQNQAPDRPLEINHSNFLYYLEKEKETWVLKMLFLRITGSEHEIAERIWSRKPESGLL